MEHHWVRIIFGRLAAGGKQDRTTTKAVETLLSLSDSFSSSEFFFLPPQRSFTLNETTLRFC